MSRSQVTEKEVADFLDYAEDASCEALDLSKALSKQITLDGEQLSAHVAKCLYIANRYVELSCKLASIARHAEDMARLKKDLQGA